jgi:thiol-disulfide isomerase/thioredoxin
MLSPFLLFEPVLLSISIGPLALPVAPLILLVSTWLAAALLRRLVLPGDADRAENSVWLACLLGLLMARIGYVLIHANAYFVQPWAIFDVRDWGWFAPAGWLFGLLWLVWRAHQWPDIRRAMGIASSAGLAIWLCSHSVIFFMGGGQTKPFAPSVSLTGLKSNQVLSLPEVLKGQPAVVNLWASWCGPCRAEMPVLFAAQQHARDILFVFVNQGESPTAVQTYLQRSNLALEHVWLDPTAALGPASGSRGLPTTLFFDAQGRQVAAHFGVINAPALQVQLDQLRERD